ncbi:MAG: c-type cytochrome [Burkholderiales bacterium]
MEERQVPRIPALILSLAALATGVAVPSHAADPPAKVPDTIEQRMLACAICHGKQGEGIRKNEYYPRLAGKPAGYLYEQMVNFRERRRDVPIMTYMVSYLSDVYLHEIAEYYSRLRPPYPAPATVASKEALARGEALTMKGDPTRSIPACTACHGASLTGLEPAIPGLVGLQRDYIAAQMGAWKIGQRKSRAPDCMRDIAARLSPEDVRAIALWLSAQPASAQTPPAPAQSLKLPMNCGSLR